MLGELVYCADGDGQPRRQERYGLTVLRAEVRPGGWGEAGRLKRAARRLARLGVCRVLVPEEFCRWELLYRWGLGPVDPVPFFRACAGGLALAVLRREGIPPHQGTVALRGRRVDRDMVRAAEFLCSRVRDVAVSAPVGGGELAAWLRREFGAPIRPDSGAAGADPVWAGGRAGRNPPAGLRSGAGGQGKTPPDGRALGVGTGGAAGPRIYLTAGNKVSIITHTA